MTTPKTEAKRLWRSLDDLSNTPRHQAMAHREFPESADEIELDGVSRRGFMGVMGASAALASGGIAGCVRKPAQYILPYAERPEDVIPGVPRFYASVLQAGGTVQGVLVENHDGRPTKIEGNPKHPASLGRTTSLVQAAVLGLYDVDRSRGAVVDGVATPVEEAVAGLRSRVFENANAPAGAAVLALGTASPTLNALIERLRSLGVSIFRDGPDVGANEEAGVALVSTTRMRPVFVTERAKVMLALDSDFLASGPHAVANAAGFAAGRGAERGVPDNRLYAVEPHFSTTGACADNRLQIPASQIGAFAKALAAKIAETTSLPAGTDGLASALAATSDAPAFDRWVEEVAKDLIANRGSSLVVVGERQPAWVHAIGVLINELLGNRDRTVRYVQSHVPAGQDLAALVESISAGRVQRLVILGGNPVYSAPAGIDFAAEMAKVATTIHLGYHYDETGRAATIHVPQSHELEAWGDLVSRDGTPAIAQPMIEPLFPSVSAIELLLALLGETPDGYEAVRSNWRDRVRGADFESAWRNWLHEGVVGVQAPTIAPVWRWSGLAPALAGSTPPMPTASSFEVAFHLDSRVYDGRYANNAWLQELPDTITKLTWDNAALINPVTARAMGIPFGTADRDENVPATLYGGLDASMVTVTVNGNSMTLPVLVTPGVAENVCALPLGFGREFGSVARGSGFATHRLQSFGQWFATGATVARAAGSYKLATTQDHGSIEGRPLYMAATIDQYRENPTFVADAELMEARKLRSPWVEPNEREGQQWGMAIDLSTCIGCNACTIACQAENSISVVGKERVLEGREMHWIRLDRYFAGDPGNPDVAIQPVTCMHCENAPCEQVCPVAATTHGPEGTNDMAYNRCIGTRYCANNCPYKVRRFNYFNFSRENDERNPLYRLQKNPDVTVRFRGVMEKCTYCVQRINAAKIHAKVNTAHGVVPEGGITPACGQVCPTNAIVFGDINNPESRVARLRAKDLNYAMLSWLNVHPRTTYLARISNPNTELV